MGVKLYKHSTKNTLIEIIIKICLLISYISILRITFNKLSSIRHSLSINKSCTSSIRENWFWGFCCNSGFLTQIKRKTRIFFKRYFIKIMCLFYFEKKFLFLATLIQVISQRRESNLPHSFRTSFYLFAAVRVSIGLPNLSQTVFWE